MTALEQQLLDRLAARAARLQPDLAQRLLACYRLLRDSLSEAELARMIASGNADRLIDELLNDRALDDAFSPLRELVDRMVMQAARTNARDLPASLRGNVFNVISEPVIQAARTLDTRVIQGLKDDVRATVRQAVIAGFQQGVNPREVARQIRDVLPLAPNQEAAVRNFRRMLEQGDAEALTRSLRDRRFDGTLRKAFAGETRLPAAKIETMTDAYRRGMVRFNAETQARSAALDAQRAGQRASWGDAIDRGVINRTDIVRTWIAVGGPMGDGRNRPEHLAMHGQQAAFDQPYSNGQLVPGEDDYNCRCTEKISVVRARVSLAA